MWICSTRAWQSKTIRSGTATPRLIRGTRTARPITVSHALKAIVGIPTSNCHCRQIIYNDLDRCIIITSSGINKRIINTVSTYSCNRWQKQICTCTRTGEGSSGRYSRQGGILENKTADKAFFEYLRSNLNPNIQIIDCDEYIEDPVFVERAVDLLLELVEQ